MTELYGACESVWPSEQVVLRARPWRGAMRTDGSRQNGGTAVTSQIAEQRAALQAEWAGQTLCDALAATAERFGDLPAYFDRDDDGPWHTLTWAQARAQALDLAAGFIALGLQPGDKVALMLPNRLEHV